MSKSEWTKIGNVEVCVVTDGVTGVWNGTYVSAIHPGDTSPDWITTKDLFEVRHCQPPAPRHIREDYADGSVVIKSVEKDEQGRPLRVAFVRAASSEPAWLSSWKRVGMFQDTEQDAIDRAIRYVETGGVSMWNWTPNKKIGDEVAVHRGGSWHGRWVTRKIIGETATQWLLPDGTRIRKKDGMIVGQSHEHVYDMSDEMRKHIAEVDRESWIGSEAQKIINRVRNMWSEDGGREWLVKHIGPILPKEGE